MPYEGGCSVRFESSLQMGCEMIGLSLEAEVLERCRTYASLLEEWNAKMNLTAIEDAEAVAMKHFEIGRAHV